MLEIGTISAVLEFDKEKGLGADNEKGIENSLNMANKQGKI